MVVYSSDHGDWLGDHGLILKGPMHYEGLLRVGLILRGPGIPAGGIVDDPVSTIDLPASFADWAGVPGLDARHSTSLRPLIESNGVKNGKPATIRAATTPATSGSCIRTAPACSSPCAACAPKPTS